MDYEAFKKKIAEDVKQWLSACGYDDVELNFWPVEKANFHYEALAVRMRKTNVGVNLNVESAYEVYKRTGAYTKTCEDLMVTLMRGFEDAPVVDSAAIRDYDIMKSKIAIEVISAEENVELLAKVPHERMEDLAVVYRLVLESNDDGRTSALVTNELLELWKIDHDQLKADAMERVPKNRPAVVYDMMDIMKEYNADDMFFDISGRKEVMYVASVPDNIGGAGVIAYPGFMDQAAEKLGGDFWILPSSVHEVLLVVDDGKQSAKALCRLVQSVNSEEVRPEERLSDHAYHYDRKERVFELGEKYEARVLEKGAVFEQQVGHHKSVVKDLKDKQQKVSNKVPMENTEKKIKSKEDQAL